MTGNNLGRAEPWLGTAKSDRDAARYLRDGQFWPLACFLCQQAAEKALKAYLRACGETADVGHGLTGLCYRCAEHDTDLKGVMDECRRLGRHYVPTRYPDALGDESPDEHYVEQDAVTALEDADRVLDLVEAKIDALRQADRGDESGGSAGEVAPG